MIPMLVLNADSYLSPCISVQSCMRSLPGDMDFCTDGRGPHVVGANAPNPAQSEAVASLLVSNNNQAETVLGAQSGSNDRPGVELYSLLTIRQGQGALPYYTKDNWPSTFDNKTTSIDRVQSEANNSVCRG
jgi:hypothetical protein